MVHSFNRPGMKTQRSRSSGLLGLGLLAWLAILLLISVLLLYGFLRSPLLHSQVWPYLQPVLEEHLGMDIGLGDIRVDLLGHLELRGLDLREHATPGVRCAPMTLRAEAVSLRLQMLALLRRHVQVEQLEAENVQIAQCIDAAVTPSPPDPLPPDPATRVELPELVQPWLELLDTLPVTLDLKGLDLGPVAIDLTMHHPEQTLRWLGRVHTRAQIVARPDRLRGELSVQLQTKHPFSWHEERANGPLRASLQPDLNADLHWDLHRHDGDWVLDLPTAHLDLLLRDLQLELTEADSHLALDIARYPLRIVFSGTHARLAEPWPLAVDGSLHGSADPWVVLRWHEPEQHPLQIELEHELTLAVTGPVSLIELVPDRLLLNLDTRHEIAQWQGHWQDQVWQLGPTRIVVGARAEGPEAWQAQAQVDLGLQHSPWHVSGAEPQLLGPLNIALALRGEMPADEVALDLAVAPFAVQASPLQAPVPLALELQNRIKPAAWQIAQRGQLRMAEDPLLEWQLDAQDEPGQLRLETALSLHLQPAWVSYLDALAALTPFGPLHTQNSLDLRLSYPGEQFLDWAQQADWAGVAFQDLSGALDWEGRLAQLDPEPTRPVFWPEPLRFGQTLRWDGAEAAVDARFNLPQLGVPDQLTADGIELRLEGRLPWPLNEAAEAKAAWSHRTLHLPELLRWREGQAAIALQATPRPEHWHIAAELNADGSELGLLPEDAELASRAFPLHLTGDLTLDRDFTAIEVDALELMVADWLRQDLSGDVALDGQTLLISGDTTVTGRDGLLEPWLDGVTASGQLRLPWQLNRVGGQQISLSTEVHFADWHLGLPSFQLQGLSGYLTLDQDLELLPDARLRFSHLLTPETFQRVDFNRVAPFLGGRDELTIEHLSIGAVKLGPLRATVPVEQNLWRIQDFRLALLDGDMAGQFYLDVTPGAWRLGLLSRISQVDIRPLLPEHLQRGDANPINARTAVEFDLNRRLLEGRLDITEINRMQLLQLLDLIDPDQRDAQVARARSALRLAHPRWVTAEMQNGLLDLSLGLSLFDQPIHVRGLPLSPIIARFGAELILLPDRVPLESRP